MGRRCKDLTGQRFGLWSVQSRGKSTKQGLFWKCLCDCGQSSEVPGSKLRNGASKSCGCGNRINLIGHRFGRLTVLHVAGKTSKRIAQWTCECDCGEIVTVRGDRLRRGETKSCGCLTDAELIGQVYGKLTVVSKAQSPSGSTYWNCLCDCGKFTVVRRKNLTSGKTSSCGCLVGKATEGKGSRKQMTGTRIGNLTILSFAFSKNGRPHWNCQCDCGKQSVVSSNNLIGKTSTSCGCKKTISKLKHGEAGDTQSVEYMAWRRVYNQQDKVSYPDEWRDYIVFLHEIGRRPSPNHRLSRRDYRLPHSKTNTYWRINGEDVYEPEQHRVINLGTFGRSRTTTSPRTSTTEATPTEVRCENS